MVQAPEEGHQVLASARLVSHGVEQDTDLFRLATTRRSTASATSGAVHCTRSSGLLGNSLAATNLAAATGHVRLDPRCQRVLVLIDLATAELLSGNLPDARSYAIKAADLLPRAA